MSDIIFTLEVPKNFSFEILLEIFAVHLNKTIAKSLDKIKGRVKELIPKAITSSPEYGLLTSNGPIRGQIGLVDPIGSINEIILAIQNSVDIEHITIKPSALGLRGGFKIGILRKDYQDALSAESAKFSSNEYEVPWLKWMIFDGDKAVIDNYRFYPDTHGALKKHSRTGYGIMEKGGTWRVPPSLQGTIEDNWLLRSLSNILPELTPIIIEILTENI